MKKYVIIGTSIFSKCICDIITSEGHEVVAFADELSFIKSSQYCQLPLVSLDEMLDIKDAIVINTIGYSEMNNIRKRISNKINPNNILGNYISSHAKVYSTILSVGNIILPGAYIGPGVILGDGNIIYSNVNLTHDIEIGNYNFIAGSVTVGGKVSIGDNTFIGMNSTIRNRIEIASYSLVGAAANVLESTDKYGIYVGNPACKVLNKNSLEIKI